MLGNNMFAYCRNNPVRRIDISGTYDLDCDDTDPLDDELVHEEAGLGGGPNVANAANSSGNSNTYSPPPGGGGVTNQIQVGDITVEFGHGARHLQNSEFSIVEVEKAIAQDVVNANIPCNSHYPGHLQIGGSHIKYSGYRLNENRINVGTYYLEQF